MSVTLWISEPDDETIELGPTFPFYQAFAEMNSLGGDQFNDDGKWYALAGLASQCESQDDSDPTWLVNLEQQADEFLTEYKDQLSDNAKWILQQIVDHGKSSVEE